MALKKPLHRVGKNNGNTLSRGRVMSLTGHQTANEKIRPVCSTRRHLESVDNIDRVTNKNMSPDLGDVWRQGCPQSPEWDG